MDFTVSPNDVLEGIIVAPPSKSYTIRAVLMALLADGNSVIHSPLVSRDTDAAFNACRLFGGVVEHDGVSIEISGTAGGVRAPPQVVDASNSGTTIRIATAVAALCDSAVELTGDESIRRRPIKPLLDALSELGVKSTSTGGCPPVTVKGPLLGGVCSIPGNVSSQFITALLVAAPYARHDVTVNLTTEMKSRPYVDLTLDMLARFKIEVANDGYVEFTVRSNQTYRAAEYKVEGDYSSAAFILAAAALTKGKVTVTNLTRDSLQADRKIVEIISEMGAEVKIMKDYVTVDSDGKLSGITVDLSDSPDLVPVVAALGALAEGETEILNASHARLKECDRIKAMAAELAKMGADVTEREDGLVIKGGGLKGAKVVGWRDHRIIMALTVAGFKAQGATHISGAEHVDVTYPDFRRDLNRLGASIR